MELKITFHDRMFRNKNVKFELKIYKSKEDITVKGEKSNSSSFGI